MPSGSGGYLSKKNQYLILSLTHLSSPSRRLRVEPESGTLKLSRERQTGFFDSSALSGPTGSKFPLHANQSEKVR